MSAQTERLLNLMFALINTRVPLSKADIRVRVGGYDRSASVEAFNRMFERDKKMLRDIHVPLQTKPIDPGFNDEDGYKIDRDAWLLPELDISELEQATLSIAVHAWKNKQIATQANNALGWLTDSPFQRATSLHLGLANGKDGVNEIFEAICNRKVVRFDYKSREQDDIASRTVDPWRIIVTGGHWYLVGFDHDRQERRTYKLDRIKSQISILEQDVTNEIPADFSAIEVVSHWRQVETDQQVALIRATKGRAGLLRLQATDIDEKNDHDLLHIEYSNEIVLARDLASVCDYVEVIEPLSLAVAVTEIIRKSMDRNNL